ncbi:type II secretion system protein GspN [Myxococcota bacterium]
MTWEPSPRLRKVAKWSGYPLFYLFALLMAARATFPFERVKQRVVTEFAARNAKESGKRLEIDELSGYWLFGAEADGVRLLGPPEAKEESDDTEKSRAKEKGKPTKTAGVVPSASAAGRPSKEGSSQRPAGEGKVLVDLAHVHVSVSPWRWLWGTTKLSFGAQGFGGELEGRYLAQANHQELEVQLDKVELARVGILSETLNMPLGGSVTGTVSLELPEQKVAKSTGMLGLTVEDFSVGDGRAKLGGMLALPKCSAGQLSVGAAVEEGKLKLSKFAAKGPDAEATAEGQVRLRDPFKTSQVDIRLRYKFTDRYMGKSDITKSLFGEPGTKRAGLMDLNPKVKRAKLPGGFYAWRLMGTLTSPRFQPAASESSRTTSKTRRAKRSVTDPETE